MKTFADRHKELLKKHQELKDNYKPSDRLKQLIELAESRRFKTTNDIPDYVRAKLKVLLDDIVTTYSPKTVDLVGSYSSGRYVDENTPDEFKSLRMKSTKELSDFDFVTDQRIVSGKIKLGELVYELVSLGQHHDKISPPLRIYENGKTLL